MRALLLAAVAATALTPAAFAETITFDAREEPKAPMTGHLKMGANKSPAGSVLEVNSHFVTRDGEPWIPVMGEMHYTRVPEAEWEREILKIKASGVNVISTYVIWQHHEDAPGQFNFSGNRNLRKFVELCAKHGLYVFVRPGPWAHAEVRYGGIPDYVVNQTFPRSDDPLYLSYVDRYFGAVGEQLKGLWFKDGGPIIGTQIENEYNRTGPLQGRDHIATLKTILQKHGFDTPLYTVTGWDNAVFPRGEVIPVYGTYVDEPWSVNLKTLPAKASYFFQFLQRGEKGLGAQGRTSNDDDGERDRDVTPFFGAEYGGGVPEMYRRRPIIAPEDIGAVLPTKLGSGLNLVGYYMYHGGTNPAGSPSRQESVESGGYNDTPERGYNFQAPYGQYGQPHDVLGKLRPWHYFLNDFGPVLAPTTSRIPDVMSKAPDDLTTLRSGFRGDGKSGFLFVNNHVRQYPMAAHAGVQFKVQLADGDVLLPTKPVDIADGVYFMWPVNMDLDGEALISATVQPVAHLGDGTFVFRTTPGIAPELVFKGKVHRPSATKPALIRQGKARLLIIPDAQADDLQIVTLEGQRRLIVSDALVYEGPEGGIEAQSESNAFSFGIYPAITATGPLKCTKGVVLQTCTATLPVVTLTASVEQVRTARKVAPHRTGAPRASAQIPEAEAFNAAAAWKITLPELPATVADAYLDIRFEGDVARLFSGPEMIDDTYYNGLVWRIGLDRFRPQLKDGFLLTVLPLREDAKIYLDPAALPKTYTDGQVVKLNSVTLKPVYRLSIP